MKTCNSKIIFKMVTYNAKSIDTNKIIKVYYNSFIGDGGTKYINSNVVFNLHNNTATKLLLKLHSNLATGQTSIKLELKSIMKWLEIKDGDTVRDAIKLLIKNNCIFRWKDLITEENVVKPTNDWYLLNPLVVRNISYDDWTSNEKHTVKEINDKSGYVIGNYDALTLDSFLDIPNDNTNNDVIDKDRKALVLKSFGRRGVKS